MINERDIDCGQLYEDARVQLVGVVRDCDTDALGTIVAATPKWTVRDVLAHVVGIAADLNALSFGDGDADTWTDAQVATRRHCSVDELAAEWDREAPRFEEGLRLLGYEIGSHYVADLLQHTADVRTALGLPNIADGDALAAGLDFYVDYLHQCLAGNPVPVACTIEIAGHDERWTVGTGEPVATLVASRFEVFRALGGRRSRAQMATMHWRGDSNAVLPLLPAYPPPDHDVVDTTPGP